MRRIACLTVFVGIGTLIGVGHLDWFRGAPNGESSKVPSPPATPTVVPQVPLTLADVRRQASDRARPHLDRADHECEEIVAEPRLEMRAAQPP